MLTPIGEPLPHDLQARGYHILETLEGLGMEQQLNVACRTLLAVLLMRRPNPSAPKAQREAFKTICVEVQTWLKDEIAEIRRVKPASEEMAPTEKPRQRMGRA